MSLNTVLKIGQTFRKSENGLRYHRYFKSVADELETIKKNKDSAGNYLKAVVFNLPILEKDGQFSFDFENLSELVDENKLASLLYLNYKTSDKDKEKKYIFGDILFSRFVDKKGKENLGGNYRLPTVQRTDGSFLRGKSEVESLLKESVISRFRACLKAEIKSVNSPQEIDIEKFVEIKSKTFLNHEEAFKTPLDKIEKDLLVRFPAVGIHFSFPNGKDWHAQEGVMENLKDLLLDAFVVESKAGNQAVFALSKTLFKTIKTPIWDKTAQIFKDPDGVGGATPGFSNQNAYKLKAFHSKEDVFDLMYAIDFSERSKISVGKDIGIVVLPKGDNLTVESLIKFIGRSTDLEEEANEEETLVQSNKPDDSDSDTDGFFENLIDNVFDDEVLFDLVFLKPKGLAAPSVDLIELSNIKKSHLRDIHENIRAVKSKLRDDVKTMFPKAKPYLFGLKICFTNILTNKTKAEKKLQSHLLKVLPQIYLDAYYNDPILLPAFVERTEYNLRNDDNFNYNWFRFNFLFLIHLQKNKPFTAMTNSNSYHIGRHLGIMARPFAAWRDDCPIKSFEKNYVGNLTRRIAYTEDLMKFSTELNEKLTMHRPEAFEQKEASRALAKMILELSSDPKNKYSKHECAFGFFETYFERQEKAKPKSDQPETAENINA